MLLEAERESLHEFLLTHIHDLHIVAITTVRRLMIITSNHAGISSPGKTETSFSDKNDDL